jgi:hypothetical protein
MGLTAGLDILRQRKNLLTLLESETRLFSPWPPYCADYATMKACVQHQLAAVARNHTAEKARCYQRSTDTFLSPSSDDWNQISRSHTCESNLVKVGCDKGLDWLKRSHVTLQISKWLPLRALIVC